MRGYGSSEILLLQENILQHTTFPMHYGMLHAAFLMYCACSAALCPYEVKLSGVCSILSEAQRLSNAL